MIVIIVVFVDVLTRVEASEKEVDTCRDPLSVKEICGYGVDECEETKQLF